MGAKAGILRSLPKKNAVEKIKVTQVRAEIKKR